MYVVGLLLTDRMVLLIEYGLDMSKGENATDKEFFSMTEAAIKRFDIKHYLMPIKASECELNTELVQAPFY